MREDETVDETIDDEELATEWAVLTDKLVRRGMSAGSTLRTLAAIFAVIVAIVAVVVVGFADAPLDARVSWGIGFVLAGITGPAVLWAFGTLVELQAARLDLAMLDTNAFDDER
ncbi:MAG TPA: hypothetical protein VFW74_15865 [Acidimicrobiia bacterium]|nr:hypothetical protein [Acidimicrobiia bacterium]